MVVKVEDKQEDQQDPQDTSENKKRGQGEKKARKRTRIDQELIKKWKKHQKQVKNTFSVPFQASNKKTGPTSESGHNKLVGKVVFKPKK